MTPTPITKAHYEAALARLPYYRRRWPYMRSAIKIAQTTKPRTILEIGSVDLPLFRGSTTMDVRRHGKFVPDIEHDAKRTPWPFDKGEFDLLIALQVWEHLGKRQPQAFDEAARVANNILLSLPLEWKTAPDNCHYMITRDKIVKKWARRKPNVEKVVAEPNPSCKRILLLWKIR